jgi:hypothetical protein
VPLGNSTVTVKSHPPIPKGFHLTQTLPPSKNGAIPPSNDDTDTDTVTGAIIPNRYGVPEESGLTAI